jgi:cytochrome c556
MIKKILAILGAIMLIASIIKGYHAFDARIAKAEDIKQLRQSVKQLNQRIDRNSDDDRARDIQRRIWDLEAHYAKSPPMPNSVKREIESLRIEHEQLVNKWVK